MEQPQAAGVDVARAAVLLGITAQAVRKRVRRGTLSAYKVDGVWRIVLPAAQATEAEPAQDAARPEETPQAYAALVQRLEGEVEFLRRLTEHQAGVIATLSARVPELTAPARVPVEAPESPLTSPDVALSSTTAPVSEAALKAAGVRGKKVRRRLLEQIRGLVGR